LPILAADTAESLARRLLPLEHRLLVAATRQIAAGEIALHGNRVVRNGVPLAAPLRLNDSGDLG
jgi:phosphoribosylglycinamide formyltransferase-1